MSRLLLSLLLSLSLAAHAGAPDEDDASVRGLRERLHAHDRMALENWEARLRDQLETLRRNGADNESERAIAAMLELLDAARLNLQEESELEGRCRVRSLQANDLGAYLYPWFNCEIWRETFLVFHKPTGSQRRFGLMEPEDKRSLFFLGGMYFSDEKPRGYSSDYTSEPSQDERNRDAIGLVYRIAPQHYLVAFAPNALGYELYELQTGR